MEGGNGARKSSKKQRKAGAAVGAKSAVLTTFLRANVDGALPAGDLGTKSQSYRFGGPRACLCWHSVLCSSVLCKSCTH